MPRPKKEKTTKKGEKTAERKLKKCHQRLKNQKISRNSRVFPNFNGFFRILPRVCCIFTPSASCFAVSLCCFCLVHYCFFFLFALFCYFFSVFSLFLYGFRLFFSSFLALFSPFKVSAAPCARFFGVWFSFFGFLSTFSLFFCRFCPPQFRIHLKNPLFCSILRFLFLFFCLHDRLLLRFFAFFMFFPAIVGICRGKIENSPFPFIKQ